MKYQRVLIIHESAPEREMLRQYVLAGSLKTVVKDVATKDEAFQLLAEQEFDIILSSVLHKQWVRLSREKGTHVIILIPEASTEHVDALSKLELKDYHVFPCPPEALQTKILAVSQRGIPRIHPWYDAPGTQVCFHRGAEDIEGEILKINREAILCEVSVAGNPDAFLADLSLTIRFPQQFGQKSLTNLKCSYLSTHRIQQTGEATRLQLVFLLPKMEGTQQKVFRKSLATIMGKQSPTVQWSQRCLKVNLQGHTYSFYGIHLFRIAIVLVLVLLVPIGGMVHYFSEPQGRVVWTNSQLYSRAVDETVWEKVDGEVFSARELIKVPGEASAKKEGASAPNAPTPFSGLINPTVVIRYTAHEVVILSKGGTAQREIAEDGAISYQLTGAAHLLLSSDASNQSWRLIVNGFELLAQAGALFYQDITSPAELTVVNGNFMVLPQQPMFLSLGNEIKPQAGKIELTSSHVVRLANQRVDLVQNPEGHIAYYDETFLPGFTGDDEYQHIGYALVEAGGAVLNRHSKRYDVQVKRIPLMVHDTIETGLNDQVLLQFYTKDLIRLYADGEISIRDFSLPETYPLLPLAIGLKAQDIVRPSHAEFQFKGRLRSRTHLEIKNRRFRFRSANAVVGIKGTDFETTARGDQTEVLTLSGIVGLSDKDEKQSVCITRGMMSRLVANNAPTEPEKIPEDRLRALLSESLDVTDQLQLSSFNTVDPNHIVLKKGESVSLFWNTGLRKGELDLEGRVYPLEISSDAFASVIHYDALPKVIPKVYAAILRVEDKQGRIANLDINLDIRPPAKFKQTPVVLSERIQFETGLSIIKQESYAFLNEIASTILKNKQIIGVSIEGHTDSDGSEAANLELSEQRAKAVKDYFVQRGIAGSMLQSKGFGMSRPLTKNDCEAGKAENRRVEFILTEIVPEEEN